MDAQRKQWAVWITVAAVVILAASFMPWAEINASPSISFNGPGGEPFGSNPFGGMEVRLTVNGWNGTITLAGIKLPNWTTVLLAVAAAALAWLVVSDAWQAPRFLGFALAVFGFLQVVLTLIVLVASGKATLGIGILLATACFAAMAFAAFSLAMQRPSAAAA